MIDEFYSRYFTLSNCSRVTHIPTNLFLFFLHMSRASIRTLYACTLTYIRVVRVTNEFMRGDNSS